MEKGKSRSPRKQSNESSWAFLRRPPKFLDPFMTKMESQQILERITPYIKRKQTAADLGCGWGFYSFALADFVGSEGKVYAVDLSQNCIKSIKRKAQKKDYKNIEAVSSTAADLSFIKDRSIDLAFANGLLCSMTNDRHQAIKEIKRILKPKGFAYISLGAAPPFGFVDEEEWNIFISEFNLVAGGKFRDLWTVVSLKK